MADGSACDSRIQGFMCHLTREYDFQIQSRGFGGSGCREGSERMAGVSACDRRVCGVEGEQGLGSSKGGRKTGRCLVRLNASTQLHGCPSKLQWHTVCGGTNSSGARINLQDV